jgi:hypothetical protein
VHAVGGGQSPLQGDVNSYSISKKDVILSLVFIHFPIYSLLAILLYLLVYCVGAHIFYLYLILVPGAKNTNKKKWKEYQKI